jgi:hypothetical protein
MKRLPFLSIVFLLSACSTPEAEANLPTSSQDSEMEGVFQYFGGLMGQSIISDGHHVFLYGPADGSGPMTSHAGTYEISGGVMTHTINFHTNPDRVGDVFSWKIESTAGDTVFFVTMDESGEISGQGRSVRVR